MCPAPPRTGRACSTSSAPREEGSSTSSPRRLASIRLYRELGPGRGRGGEGTRRQGEQRVRRILALMSVVAALSCAGGVPGPAALDTKTDTCRSCRMPVSDASLASQLVAPGEEPKFFDDIVCLRDFLAGSSSTRPEERRLCRRPPHRGLGARLGGRVHTLEAGDPDGLALDRPRRRGFARRGPCRGGRGERAGTRDLRSGRSSGRAFCKRRAMIERTRASRPSFSAPGRS